MGLCWSCNKSTDKFKAKSSKICSQIQSAVSPTHEAFPKQSGKIMASSFSNMNIKNPIRGLVSKNKRRYKKDGFDLDLTYITESIIAMGFPASSLEGVWRNNIDDVVKFLDKNHENHYYIYNLCSEKSYNKNKFHNRVLNFPFDDHNPPKIESIRSFCDSVQGWLKQDRDNVAAVHCKAGKGRTGTMICCYLLHSGICENAEMALEFYGKARTDDLRGVTIPSQMRYVNYYERLLKNSNSYNPLNVYIKEFILDPAPSFAGVGQSCLSYTISKHNDGQKLKKLCKNDSVELKLGDMVQYSPWYSIKLNHCLPLKGDIKVEFYNKPKLGRKEKLFQFWFNTNFLCKSVDQGGTDYVLVLKKNELDIVNKKDKQNKVFSAEFQLSVVLEKVPVDHHLSRPMRPTTLEQETPSGSSDSSDAEEDDWDSGESTYL